MRHAEILLALLLVLGGCVSTKRSRLAGADPGQAGFGERGTPSRPEPEPGNAPAPSPPASEPGGEPREQPFTGAEAAKHTESILSVIGALEECYRTGDFEKWQSLLTPLYREKHSDPEYLRAQGWDADDLRDFFRFLITTRKGGNVTALEISRVEFENPGKARVFVILDGREFPEPQHTFVRTGDSWLKGLPEEGE
jgi:hypothetical protein